MSQKQDLLFCKIAISNGRVTQDQAKKCLAIASKREVETGRRPSIGSVFSKYNLMRKQEVNAIYEAIAKRTGIAPPSAGAPAAGGGKGSTQLASRGRKPSFADDRPRRVDPNTLWLGVAFGVIFLGIVIGLVWMFVSHTVEDPDDKKKAGKAGSAATAGVTPGAQDPAAGAAASGAAGAATAGAAGAKPPPAPVKAAVMNESDRLRIRQYLSDARQLSLVDAARALANLQKLELEIAKKVGEGTFIDPGLKAEIASEIKNLKLDVSGAESAGGDAGAEDKVPDLDDDL
ncbi:MAG: hypothetical protein VYD81_04410 [Planctomycetota bacterium]|nr:hypothetical protein [Planctomycetota bacterium]MEE3180489.1 hypothetical protein [Planctomycetota bacterium]